MLELLALAICFGLIIEATRGFLSTTQKLTIDDPPA
jgi:hypothetical protein